MLKALAPDSSEDFFVAGDPWENGRGVAIIVS
jgi:hypothetical protein